MDGCFHFHVKKQTKQNNNKNSTTVDTSICNTESSDHVSNLTGMADVNCQEKKEKKKNHTERALYLNTALVIGTSMHSSVLLSF